MEREVGFYIQRLIRQRGVRADNDKCNENVWGGVSGQYTCLVPRTLLTNTRSTHISLCNPLPSSHKYINHLHMLLSNGYRPTPPNKNVCRFVPNKLIRVSKTIVDFYTHGVKKLLTGESEVRISFRLLRYLSQIGTP